MRAPCLLSPGAPWCWDADGHDYVGLAATSSMQCAPPRSLLEMREQMPRVISALMYSPMIYFAERLMVIFRRIFWASRRLTISLLYTPRFNGAFIASLPAIDDLLRWLCFQDIAWYAEEAFIEIRLFRYFLTISPFIISCRHISLCCISTTTALPWFHWLPLSLPPHKASQIPRLSSPIPRWWALLADKCARSSARPFLLNFNFTYHALVTTWWYYYDKIMKEYYLKWAVCRAHRIQLLLPSI